MAFKHFNTWFVKIVNCLKVFLATNTTFLTNRIVEYLNTVSLYAWDTENMCKRREKVVVFYSNSFSRLWVKATNVCRSQRVKGEWSITFFCNLKKLLFNHILFSIINWQCCYRWSINIVIPHCLFWLSFNWFHVLMHHRVNLSEISIWMVYNNNYK